MSNFVANLFPSPHAFDTQLNSLMADSFPFTDQWGEALPNKVVDGAVVVMMMMREATRPYCLLVGVVIIVPKRVRSCETRS
jgi:hypothetical protein